MSARKTSPPAHEHPVDGLRVARARDRLLSAEDAARLAGVLTLLADPVRSRILYALALGTTEDAISYGLRILRTAGLVQTRKDGRIVFYRLADNFPEPLLEHCLRQLLVLSRAAQVLEAEEP